MRKVRWLAAERRWQGSTVLSIKRCAVNGKWSSSPARPASARPRWWTCFINGPPATRTCGLLAPDEPLRQSFLAAAPVRRILSNRKTRNTSLALDRSPPDAVAFRNALGRRVVLSETENIRLLEPAYRSLTRRRAAVEVGRLATSKGDLDRVRLGNDSEEPLSDLG
jgi:hypothetical protein